MNRINIQQTGGFPLETDACDFMQTAYAVFNALGDLAGNLAIIKGCELIGTSLVGDGVVYINGELLEFKGGAIGDNVMIRQEITTRVFEDGDEKEVYYTRYATFGSGTTSYAWVDFERVTNLQELKALVDALDENKADNTTVQTIQTKLTNLIAQVNALNIQLVPVGAITMWAGNLSDIPNGWALCDGSNGTPDLRGQFIVGYNPNDSDYNTMGETGGMKQNTPSGVVNNRYISLTIPRDGWNTTGNGLGQARKGRLLVGSGQHEQHEGLESIRAAGSNKTVSASHNHILSMNDLDNRPPYYTLAFIQFKGA